MATFPYRCPQCGSRYKLRRRVTLTRRHCAYCGKEITPEEIDRQQLIRRIIGFLVFLLFFVLWVLLCSGGLRN
jgi:uncharacterized protein (DUF983 family)